MGSDPAVSGSRLMAATVVEERPAAIYAREAGLRAVGFGPPSGHSERNFVRLVPGDRVEVELAPHDPGRGRIKKKL